MKVLIISKEAWRDEQNGGNVLSNIFNEFHNVDFAQIYCSAQEPNNIICKKYYQITDKMMVDNIVCGRMVGREINYKDCPTDTMAGNENYTKIAKSIGGEFARACRELVWALGKLDRKAIISFVRNFQPDVIFAPCNGIIYMQKLVAWLHSEFDVPIVSYIYDDFYSNSHIRISPVFWIRHFLIRNQTRKTFKHYSLCYTMTDEQKEQCEKDFGTKMKILRKSGTFDDQYVKQVVNSPIRIVYAGGIYLNRWKTLVSLANAITSINQDELKLVLNIYTNNELDDKIAEILNDGINSRVHKAVSMTELMEVYRNSDIALHAEAFDLKNRRKVRMSFSTKIVDCLDSGCAVMAICDKKQAGGAYLRRNDAAICVHDLSELESTLRNIVNNPQIIVDYQHRAFELGRKNHLRDKISKDLRADFEKIIDTKQNTDN